MNVVKISSVVILAIGLLVPAVGSEPLINMGLAFDAGFPQEEFRDNVDNAGLGIGLYMVVGSTNHPFGIGGSVDFMQYGEETREEPWSTTIPDVFVDVTTTNDLVAGHLFMRVQPTDWVVQPYVEGLIGLHYLSTTTSVSDQGDDDEPIASTKQLSDFAFSYGLGAGIRLRVWRPSPGSELEDYIPDDEGEATWEIADEETPAGAEEEGGEDKGKVESVGLFLDIRYLRGGEADYLREGSIQIDNGRVRYDVRRSRTDIMIMRVGVSVNIM
jgi:hypothetical protein